MRIAMIGTGYVGLVSGACFADFGHEVAGLRQRSRTRSRASTAARCRSTNRGWRPWSSATSPDGRLSFSTSLDEALAGAEIVFLAVGTPSREGDGHADLSFVWAAVDEIAERLRAAVRHRCQIDRPGWHQPGAAGARARAPAGACR